MKSGPVEVPPVAPPTVPPGKVIWVCMASSKAALGVATMSPSDSNGNGPANVERNCNDRFLLIEGDFVQTPSG